MGFKFWSLTQCRLILPLVMCECEIIDKIVLNKKEYNMFIHEKFPSNLLSFSVSGFGNIFNTSIWFDLVRIMLNVSRQFDLERWEQTFTQNTYINIAK